jgi:hypothetical protein
LALGNRIEQVDLGFWRARMLLERDRPGDREAAAALAAELSTTRAAWRCSIAPSCAEPTP